MKVLCWTSAAALAVGMASTFFSYRVAAAQATVHFDIPAGPLGNGLKALGLQSGQQVLFRDDLVARQYNPAVRGSLSTDEALQRLLKGTGLAPHRTSKGVLYLQVALVSAPAGPAPASQDIPPATLNDPAEGASAASKVELEEIVVTAQRRSQNLQDVPVAVSAFTGPALTAKGIQNVADLQLTDSSLFISQMNALIMPFIRGIGNPSGPTPGNEASTPVYIDDVYYSRPMTAYLELANIERVEVLKGPQGTLFGRNSTGGLMHVFTLDPRDVAEGNVTLGYGNFDTISGKLYASTPIAEGVAANISVVGLNQRDGWGKNVTNGKDTYRRKFYNIRSKIVIEPSDSTRVRLSGFYTYQRTNQGLAARVYPGTTRGYPLGSALEGTQYIETPGFYDLKSDTEIFHRLRSYGGAVKIDQDLEFADLTSITSYRRSKELEIYEGDHTDINWFTVPIPIDDRQFTQELQLKSKPDSPVSWIAGLFYIHLRTDVGLQLFGLGSAFNIVNFASRQTIDSIAPFAQATFPVVGEKTNITVGVRYTKDRLKGFGRSSTILTNGTEIPSGPDFRDKKTFEKWTYKFSLDHHFTSDVMGYASYSRGYKSGTFPTLPLNSPPTRPETVTTYEVGMKAELFDRRVRANMAIFLNDIRDPQVQLVRLISGLPLVVFANADKARTKGFEFDTTAKVTDGLTIDLSGQYLWAHFISFPNAPINIPIFQPPWGVALGSGDVSGNRLSQTPKWKLNAGLTYAIPTSVGEFRLAGQMSYRSNVKWDPDNIPTEPKLTLFNGSIEFKPEFNENISFRIWGANLTNEKYFSYEIPQTATPAGDLGTVAPPRTFGAEVRYQF